MVRRLTDLGNRETVASTQDRVIFANESFTYDITYEDLAAQLTTTLNFVPPSTLTLYASRAMADSLDSRVTSLEGSGFVTNSQLQSVSNRVTTLENAGFATTQVTNSLDTRITALENVPESNSWEFYATNWTSTPTFNQTIAAGGVYNYTLDGITRYRLVPNPYISAGDAFYETFSGGALSDLIVSRG